MISGGLPGPGIGGMTGGGISGGIWVPGSGVASVIEGMRFPGKLFTKASRAALKRRLDQPSQQGACRQREQRGLNWFFCSATRQPFSEGSASYARARSFRLKLAAPQNFDRRGIGQYHLLSGLQHVLAQGPGRCPEGRAVDFGGKCAHGSTF